MDIKRILTDILAYVLGIGTAIAAVLETLPPDVQWYVLIPLVIVGIVSWFTGRNGDGSKKERITKH